MLMFHIYSMKLTMLLNEVLMTQSGLLFQELDFFISILNLLHRQSTKFAAAFCSCWHLVSDKAYLPSGTSLRSMENLPLGSSYCRGIEGCLKDSELGLVVWRPER